MAEEKRREIGTCFTSLVKDVADHASITLDMAGRIVGWNLEAERLLGYSEGEAVGQHFSLLFTAEDVQQGVPQAELRLATEDGRAENERWYKRQNGERLWALGIVTPMLDAHGRRIGFAKILRDLTARKELELTLRETDRRKDEFLATLSHELRDPLSAALNAVQLLAQGDNDEGTRQLITRVIERQVQHMTRMVDDLLEVSRITTGRIHLQLARVNLLDVIKRAVERTRPALQRHGQDLTVAAPQNPIWIKADASRLEQVFGNLLNNASKFGEIGGRVWLRVEREADHVVVRVRDEGIGMEPDLLSRAFALFAQSDRSLDRSEGGLGIGLALVKNLVELHHGTIEARSEGPGMGSEFLVRLAVISEPKVEQETLSPQPPDATAEPLRVLILDDNVDAAQMMSMLLCTWGHEVRVAHRGPDAIRIAHDYRPHLILLDIGLPEMSGYDVARYIRQDPRIHEVHLAAVTGHGQPEDRERSKRAGFDTHLIKPVDASALKALLAEVRVLAAD